MEVTGVTRKRPAVDNVWNWNGTPEISMINPSVSNGFQMSTKRRCNGLQYSHPASTLHTAPVYHQKHTLSSFTQDQQQYNRHVSMQVDATNDEEMDTQTVNDTEVTKSNNVCLRCLAGEPGHIMHILG